jgi:hypothetical protein
LISVALDEPGFIVAPGELDERDAKLYKSELDLTDSVGYLAPMGVSVVFR